MDKITKTQTKITGKISTAIVQVLDHGQDQQDWDKDHHQHVDHSQNYAWLDLRVRQNKDFCWTMKVMLWIIIMHLCIYIKVVHVIHFSQENVPYSKMT